MNRTILVALAAALGFAGPASAAEQPGQWYVAPMASVIWTDDARYTDDDVGAAASFGKAVSEDWNLELHAFGYQLDGYNPTDLWGGGIDAARVWFRDSRITPYLLVGLGWDKKNRGFGADSDAPYTNLGLGFLTDITRNGSIALRTEVRYRMELDDEKTFQDLVANIGVQIPFGGAKAAPAAAPPPPPPPPSPPPPPPPPPADTDGDGVPDMADVCPNTPKGTRVDAVGCGCEVTLGLRFELNSAELTDEDITQLDELVGYMKKIPGLAGMIEGHTDSSGSEAYNQALSERRALSVVDYLRAAGVEADLTAVGYGETRPVADNSTAEGRATNRRVVVSRTDCN